MTRLTARIPAALALGVMTLSAAACASDGMPSRYSRDLDRLTEECRARGGILAPIPGATTARPETDFTCDIRGGASRLNN